MQHQQQKPAEEEERLTSCPSFGRITDEVEEKVCEDGGRITALTGSPQEISAVQGLPIGGDGAEEPVKEEEEEEEDHFEFGSEDDFEFAFVSRDSSDSLESITADDIFSNGKIRPAFPLFNRDLVFGADHDHHDGARGARGEEEKAVRLPLRKLLIEDRNLQSTSCSSSESDELETVPEESYCAWAPGSVTSSPDLRKKSNSTGASSKRWRLRDLVVGRSQSDGKEKYVFLASEKKKKPPTERSPIPNLIPKKATTAPAPEGEEKNKKGKGKGGARLLEMDMVTAHRLYYAKGGPATGDRRRSFLPYRKDLVGFFGNANGAGRSFHPF